MSTNTAIPLTPERRQQMEAVVSLHEEALLAYATRILNNAAAAQDVVQNAFIKLFQHWRDGMRPSRHMKTWLYRVTHNEAVDYIRRESRLRLLHKKHAEERTADCPDGLHCPAPRDDRLATVLENVHRLHPRERQVLLLRLEQGLSYQEIAEVTGRSEGNVGNILHHAVKKLSARLVRATQ